MLLFARRWGNEAMEVVFRCEEQDGRIARIGAYGFCPETIRGRRDPGSACPHRDLPRPDAVAGRELAGSGPWRFIMNDYP